MSQSWTCVGGSGPEGNSLHCFAQQTPLQLCPAKAEKFGTSSKFHFHTNPPLSAFQSSCCTSEMLRLSVAPPAQPCCIGKFTEIPVVPSLGFSGAGTKALGWWDKTYGFFGQDERESTELGKLPTIHYKLRKSPMAVLPRASGQSCTAGIQNFSQQLLLASLAINKE